MLSDPTFNTDFLTNRIMGADSSPNKRDWDEMNGSVPEETTENFFGNKSNGRSFINSDDKLSAPMYLEEPPVIHPYPTLVENALNVVDNHLAGDVNMIHSFGVCRPCDFVDSDKFLSGNREELTTPVALTGFDTTAMLESNYVGGQVVGEQCSIKTDCVQLSDLSRLPNLQNWKVSSITITIPLASLAKLLVGTVYFER